MTDFNFTLVAEDGVAVVRSAALGNNTGQFGTEHIGCLVKLGANQNYVLAGDGEQFDGQVVSVEPYTVNGGYSFGTVKLSGRIQTLPGDLAVTNYARSGAQVLGTANTRGLTAAGALATGANWRCIYVNSDHAILEKV